MKDTVAIVGSHPGTSRNFDWNRTDCDIWVFNEALNTDWCKRADGVFQIHKPVIWRSATNRNDPKHYDWLKSGETPAIFMQEDYQDVPKSEKFPLMEIFEKFPQAEKYFTSSVAYALAMATYKGYKIIEVYGVEMETQSEYGHQRVGVAYWCGIAAGLGIYVDFHSPTFFTSPLYGYEGDVKIPLDHYRKRINDNNTHKVGADSMLNKVKMMIENILHEFTKTYKADLSQLDDFVRAAGQNSHNLGMFNGFVNINQHYLDKCEKMEEESGTYLIVKQEYESQAQGAAKRLMPAEAMFNSSGTSLMKERDKFDTNKERAVREKIVADFKKGFEAWLSIAQEVGKLHGIRDENARLMQMVDQLMKSLGMTEEDIASVETAVKA